MPNTIRIAVFDDHPMMLGGILHTLGNEPEFEVVGQGASADEAIRVVQEQLPDVVLLDVSMPGDGIHAAQEINRLCPIVTIVMLTVSEDENNVTRALKAGARGYILKGVSGPEFVRSVRAVHSGENYVSPDLAARILSAMRSPDSGMEPANVDLSELTFREQQILSLVSEGLSNREIGERINLSEKTIKHYMTNIFEKLRVRNRVEAALLARESKSGT